MPKQFRVVLVAAIATVTAISALFVAGPSPAMAEDYSGHRPVLALAEIITDPASGEAGRVVWLRKDLGNGQLDHDFVYGDPRRAAFNGGEPGVTFAVNTGWTSSDANLTDQIGWLYESIDVWDNESCADLALTENSVRKGQPGVVQVFFKSGRLPETWTADLTQVGFLSARQFPYFAANPNVLGVTFTLFWEDENGNITDIDSNGKADVAFREIYYNDEFIWADNGVEGNQPNGTRVFDFPSVAIHEVGHGFSAAHFGSIGRQDGVLIADPRAVMNAIYGGYLRELLGHDVSSHCNNWSQWPNN